MGIDDIPLLSMIRGKLGYLNQRQQVVAQNIANADTPGYTPSDLKPFTFAGQLKAQAGGLQTTDPRHIKSTTSAGGATFAPEKTPDSETTLDGNQVVLEEQMMKMTEARMDYEAAIGFYQKSMNMLRTAARAPGR
jgi:flagellar basal-body rod protein FlgB